MHKEHVEEGWISLILRVSFASLFAVAGYHKFTGGLSHTVSYIQTMFSGTILPAPLVGIYAWALPFVELAIPLWLLSGIRLREAWVFTSFVLVSLAFGVVVAKNPDAANNFFYVLMSCAGLYFSKYDCCQLKLKK